MATECSARSHLQLIQPATTPSDYKLALATSACRNTGDQRKSMIWTFRPLPQVPPGDHYVRPLTHAPETGFRNRCYRPKFNARFRRVFRADARLLSLLTAFGPRRQSMTLEVARWHEKLASESGVEFMAPISGACVRGLNVEDLLMISRYC